ncbi:MAG: lipid-A-disaccharide synthase-related protein [Candidatus Margulisbacteria bacterium]|nr:lipid-A-disaccharide synthase-related protein [Candidatus Margulisiibacteriota bacterium]MBU1616591.1 lipid-A-disaccharide synthase-related protein [Candidatus Margulisiibacteriota bacterium]
MSKKVLLVSNGHAEDLAAAEIGAALKRLAPQTEIAALPLVGLGKAYEKKEIKTLGLKKLLPSGGFAKEGLFHFLKDLGAGWLPLLRRQIAILKTQKPDLVIAVGDAWVVALCGRYVKKPLLFVDGPKSVKITGYWPLEKYLMRRYCSGIVVQDQATADHLKNEKFPAHYLGSWVMDYVPLTGEDFGIESKKVIGILPGTREEAYDNLGLILKVIEKMAAQADREEKLVGLAASTLDRQRLAKKMTEINWRMHEPLPADLKRGITGMLVSPRGTPVYLAEGKFGDVCLRSDLIIGLAGIANEQAVAFGKPAVCFPGGGPQTTLRRWQEIQKITGKSMEILSGDAAAKATAIWRILRNPAKMAEMSRIGKESKPLWGGTERIVKLALDMLDNRGVQPQVASPATKRRG